MSDTDSANLTSASVVISQGHSSTEDELSAAPSGALLAGNIAYTAATGTLAITGSAPLADYQAVLRSVSYRNTNTTNPSTAARRVTFVANDGLNPSNSPIRDINVIDSIALQAIPFVESFETDGRGTRYSVDGGFSSPPSLFSRTQPGAVSGLDGTFGFGVENVDDNPDATELVTFRINGGGATGLTGELRVAAGSGAVYDNSAPTPDFLRVEVSADGGPFQNVLAFYSDAAAQGSMKQDTTPADSNNVGDGTLLTSALQTFSFNVPSGDELTVRVRAFTNIVGENILFDRLVINGPPPPTVVSVSSSSANGGYKAGQVIPVTITFTSAVTVTGTPQLTLETGTTDRTVNYASGAGTTALTFNYTVQTGDTSADLDYISSSALALNGGTIRSSVTSAAAVLTLPTPGTSGSLGANKALVIDTAAPTFASLTRLTPATQLTNADTLTFRATFSEAVNGVDAADFTVTGTTATITGFTGTGPYDITLSGGNLANFSGTVGLNLAAGQNIADPAGNPVPAAEPATDEIYTLDNAAPALAGTISLSDTVLKIGDTATVGFVFTEAVSGFSETNVTAPNAVLSGLATSDSGITWTATLTPNTGTTDATNLLTLDFTGLSDALGNTGSGTTESPNYAIDTQAPSTVGIVVADTDLRIGETSLVTFTFSEAVTDFDAADITVENALLGTLGTTDNITFTATLTPTALFRDATNVITVANTGYTDTAGNPGAGTASSNNYIVNTIPAPVVTSLSTSTGSVDGFYDVTINGSGLTGVSGASGFTASPGSPFGVFFGGTAATNFSSASDTSLTVKVPAHARGLVDVLVTTPSGTGTGASLFRYVANPTVTAAFGATKVGLGGAATLTYTLKNNDPDQALTGFAFTDGMPDGLAIATPTSLVNNAGGTAIAVAGGQSFSYSGGSVAAGGTATVSIDITGTVLGVKRSNHIAATSNEAAPQIGDFLNGQPQGGTLRFGIAPHTFGRRILTGSIGAGDSQQTGRMNRFAQISTIATPKTYPGTFTSTGARFYDSYSITNSTTDPQPVEVWINTNGTSGFVAAYLGSFNPTDPSINYLADPGSSFPNQGWFGFTIPPTSTVVLVVHEVNPGQGVAAYALGVNTPLPPVPVANIPAFDAALPTIEVIEKSISIANLAAINEGNSGTTNFVFTITRTGDTTGEVNMTYTVGGAAVNAADFGGSLPTGTATITAGNASTTVTIPVSGDTFAELDEAFTVTLSAPDNGYVISGAPATSTITNDDTLTVTLNQAAAQADPSNATTLNFTATFSEPVTDFDDAADVILTGTAAATTTLITGGPTTYNVAVSGMTGSGTVIANIPSSSVLSAGGAGNLASTSTDNTVTYDATAPALASAITISDTALRIGDTATVTFTFTEVVTGFTEDGCHGCQRQSYPLPPAATVAPSGPPP